MAALAVARQAGTFTILDIDHRPYSWPSKSAASGGYSAAARLSDAVVGNLEEFGILAGEGTEPEQAARGLDLPHLAEPAAAQPLDEPVTGQRFFLADQFDGHGSPVGGGGVNGPPRPALPGLRVYVNKGEIPRVYGGLGVAIMSTSHGVMSGQEAWRAKVGGEVICYVW